MLGSEGDDARVVAVDQRSGPNEARWDLNRGMHPPMFTKNSRPLALGLSGSRARDLIATTQLAATNAAPAEIERLKKIQANFRSAIEKGDIEGRVHHNDQFHLEIGKMAHNAYLMPSLRRLLIDHARLGKIFYRHPTTADMQQDLDKAVSQHDLIIESIERRDAEAAGEIVRAHMDLSRRRMTEYVTPVPLEGFLSFS